MNDKINKAYIKIIGLPMPSGSLKDQLRIKSLIDEDRHKELNIGQAALGYLKKNLKPEIIKIDNSILKKMILPTWKHYTDFCINCMNIDLYLLETNFRKPIFAVNQLKKIVKDLDIKSTEMILNNSMKNTYGLSFKIDKNIYVILIDNNVHKDDVKIQHEFGHYVQEVTGNLILDNNIKEDLKKYFDINDQYVNYILNEREFWINIFNDLFNGLQKIYWLRFKNIFKWEEFIDDQFNMLKMNVSNYSNTQLFKLWSIDVKINLFYIKVLAIISYAKPEFYDEIIKKLKNIL